MSAQVFGIAAHHEDEGSRFFVVVANDAAQAIEWVRENVGDEWELTEEFLPAMLLDQYCGVAELTTG